MKAHPAADIFPMMSEEELSSLAADIKAHGQNLPITTIVEDGETLILDGRNRARACEIAGIPVMSQAYGGEDPFSFVVSANLQKRHLSISERALLSVQVDRLRNGANQYRKREGGAAAPPSPSTIETAGLFDISVDSVKRGRVVHDKGTPELIEAIRTGEVSLAAGYKLARMPHDEQRSRLQIGDIPKDKPSSPPESEPRRIVDRKGRLAKPDRKGVLHVVGAVRDLPTEDPRLHREKHEQIRELAAQGMGPKAIADTLGLGRRFVQHSMTRFVTPRKGVLDRAIIDVETFAETWALIANEDAWRWPTATDEEKAQLVTALEECARAARRVINRLTKEAKEKTGT